MKILYNEKGEKICQTCGGIIKNKRGRRYCSDECRQKTYIGRYPDYRNEWAKKKFQKEIMKLPEEDRIQCLDCGKWFVQIGSHAVQAHGYSSAREYREFHDLERKRGLVPKWYRKIKGDMAMENGTYKNLEKGKKYRFKKGQEGIGSYKRSHVTIEKLKKSK